MNQLTQAPLGKSVTMSGGDGGFAVTPQTLNDVVEFAKFMCQSNAGIPAYLRGNGADCAAVIMQALKWGFDPFSVAQKSYKVKDVLAYEAQLIAAVINARSGIKGRLKYHFEGTGDDLVCTVSGILDGEECTYTSPRTGNITTKNSPLWKTDPQQQLGYYSARNWARRHCPEVILGVYDRDEAEEFRGPDRAKNITPVFDPLSDDLPPQSAKHDIDGDTPHDALTGEILPNESESGSSPPEPGTAESEPSSASAASDDSAPNKSSDAPLSERNMLIKYASDVLPLAATNGTTIDTLIAVDREWAAEIRKMTDAGIQKANAIKESSRAVFNDPARLEGVLEHYADLLECSIEQLGGAA